MESAAPLISVAVPTRDRPASLRRCLAALTVQEPRDRIEILVVDDGSRCLGEVRAAVEASGRARLLVQDAGGPAAARNTAIREARARVVCLTDDDCEPMPGWAAALAGAITAGAEVAAGVTKSAGGLWSRAGELAVAYAEERASVPFAASNNLAARAHLLAAEPFDERFSMPAGEDREWCRRVVARGVRIERVSSALVLHHRAQTFRAFWKQHHGYGSTAFHLQGLRLEPARFYTGLLGHGFRDGVATGAAVCVSQAATAVGYASAALRSRR